MEKTLPIIHALWIGSKLGEISVCCLKSFLMRGHEVHLHTYGDISDIPEGVKQVDANLIVNKNKIIKHRKTGSYALFSDIFRYELMQKVDGIYVDCDVYCLNPISLPDHGILLGYESDQSINGAILRLTPQSTILSSLIDAAYNPYYVPEWYKKRRQVTLKFKKILGMGRSISDMPWGVIGPLAITHYVKKYDLESYIQPIDVFYPVHYQCVGLLLEPGLNISDITSSRTLCVHLYNEMLKSVDLNALDSSSILYKMLNSEI